MPEVQCYCPSGYAFYSMALSLAVQNKRLNVVNWQKKLEWLGVASVISLLRQPTAPRYQIYLLVLQLGFPRGVHGT